MFKISIAKSLDLYSLIGKKLCSTKTLRKRKVSIANSNSSSTSNSTMATVSPSTVTESMEMTCSLSRLNARSFREQSKVKNSTMPTKLLKAQISSSTTSQQRLNQSYFITTLRTFMQFSMATPIKSFGNKKTLIGTRIQSQKMKK